MLWQPTRGILQPNRHWRRPQGGGGLALYDGIVATRGTVPSHGTAGFTASNSRSGHYARADITQLKVLFPNFYTVIESAPGAACTIKASIEYPAGVFTQLLFSASSSGTIPDGGILVSDYLTIAIPNGARFWIRCYRTGGIVYESGNVAYNDRAFMGDVINFNVVSDQTMTGEVTYTGENVSYHPIAIAPITIPSVMIFGDSIAAGVSDTATYYSGDMGAIARSIGPSFGYFNGGGNGEAVTDLLAHHTQKLVIAGYCSHAIFGYPTNDIAVGHSDTTIKADLTSGYALVSPKPTFQCTIPPRTTSTDSWATTANQTVAATESVRLALNSVMTGGTFGPGGGIFDIAAAVEAAGGKWVAGKTTDGIHPDTAGYSDIKIGGAIDITRIGSPALVASESGSAWGDHGTILDPLLTVRRANDTVALLADNVLVSSVRGATGRNSGLRYFEIEVLGISNNGFHIGLADATTATGAAMDDYLGDTSFLNTFGHEPSGGVGYNFNTGSIFTTVGLGAGFSQIAGDVFMYVVDFTNKFAYLGRNGAWFLSGNPTSGATGTGHVATWTGTPTLYPAITFDHMTGAVRLRTADFLFTPPAGSSAWG